MSLSEKLEKLSSKIKSTKDAIKSEEHTKMAFIAPFITILGYDVFDPQEVVPEYTCDFGTKKGEKVDYCIMNQNKPYILIECKDCRTKLTAENISQLYRYFSVSSAKLAILTNGIEYLLFTDSVEKNKMDSDPFYSFNITELISRDIKIIEMLLKDSIRSFSDILVLAKASIFENEVDNWVNSQRIDLSKTFISFIRKELNTYNLPNDEISRCVREKLFKTVDNIDKKEQAGIKLPEGTTGLFRLDMPMLVTDILGSTIVGLKIGDVEYCSITNQYELLHALLDYITCVKDLTFKELASADIGLYLEGDTKMREYKGLWYKKSITSGQLLTLVKKLCELHNIAENSIVLGLISRQDCKVLRAEKKTNEDIYAFLKAYFSGL